MGKIIEYKLVAALGFSVLETKVREAINEGWQPIGGVSFASAEVTSLTKKDLMYVQAVVKYEEQ